MAVATNSSKKPLSSRSQERVDLIRATVANEPRITVKSFDGLLVEFAAQEGATASHPRASRGERLRVRVSDGAHEPPPLAKARDRVHGPVARHDVHQRESRPRDRALRRRRFEPGASGGRGTRSRRVSRRNELSRRRCTPARPRPRGASSFPNRPTSARGPPWPSSRAEGSSSPIVVLDPDGARNAIAAVRALGVERARSERQPLPETAAQRLSEPPTPRGITKERGARASPHAAASIADALVALGQADGCVAGAVHTTGDVLRASLWLVGPAGRRSHGLQRVLHGRARHSAARAQEVLTFTDCAVVRYPTATQLADIAIAAAVDRRRIVGDEPIVAFLSFSTRGSAAGASVDLVRAALAEVRARMPELAVDGELQGDAALASAVAGSQGAGQRRCRTR